MHARHRIDASAADALYAMTAATSIAAQRSPPERIRRSLLGLSVRSSFDLVLTALRLAPGDEVLVSAITHPDMWRIIALHGLRAIPVDLEPRTLAPTAESLAVG